MLYLKSNLPVLERAVRITLAVGLVIATIALGVGGWMRLAAYASAATLAATAFIGFCPACWLFGRKPIARAS